MATSGTYSFALANSSIIMDAYDRIQVRPAMLEPHHMVSARMSLNLELLDWSNKGFNFWETTGGSIPLVANQAVYQLPDNLVMLTELWYSQLNGAGAGINQDRIMVPITRTQYAMVTNKLQPGTPTQYWFQMLSPTPQITIWEVPPIGQVAPNYVLNWYGLSQIQDANIGGTETPNVAYRAIDALISGLALRLFEKFGPTDDKRPAMLKEKAQLAENAWEKMTRRDQEPGPFTFRPDVSVYSRLK